MLQVNNFWESCHVEFSFKFFHKMVSKRGFRKIINLSTANLLPQDQREDYNSKKTSNETFMVWSYIFWSHLHFQQTLYHKYICFNFIFRLTSPVFMWHHFSFLVAFYVAAAPYVQEVVKRRKMKLERIKCSTEACLGQKFLLVLAVFLSCSQLLSFFRAKKL